MDGFFESMVKSMKSILRKAIRNVRLNYVEMLTVLKEVKNVINNRPLSYVYYDELYEVLTFRIWMSSRPVPVLKG